MEVQRICEYCGKEFTAKTTVTRYCSHKCNQRAYKANEKLKKIRASNAQTNSIKYRPIEELNAKEFLTVREASQLLNYSVRTTYNLIDNGTIKSTNLGERMTRIKRSDIDDLFKE